MSIYEIYCLVGFVCFMILTCIFILALFFDYLEGERAKRLRLIEREDERIFLFAEKSRLSAELVYLQKRVSLLEEKHK